MLIFLSCQAFAQMPTHIDAGQEEDPVRLWENPQLIIPVVLFIVAMIGIGIWRRRKRP